MELNEDGLLDSYVQLHEGFTNQIAILDEFMQSKKTIQFNGSRLLKKIHLRNLTGVAKLEF